jgi:hypothetical protein
MNPHDIGAGLRDLIVAIVDERLRELGIGATSTRFSSTSLPPHTSRRLFNEACKAGKIDGARKVGRVWECEAKAWTAARSTKPVAPTLRLVHDRDAEPSVDECIEQALRGIRGQR